jgi:hypothetical protein
MALHVPPNCDLNLSIAFLNVRQRHCATAFLFVHCLTADLVTRPVRICAAEETTVRSFH